MVWVPGTDYPPAQQHVGYPVSVLPDGTETGATPLPAHEAVIGWRSGCDCGWRGRQFYSRAEWPSPTGEVPAPVEGWEDATATCGEWVRHVQQAVPELPVHELARQLTAIQALDRSRQRCASGGLVLGTDRRRGRGQRRPRRPTLGQGRRPRRPFTDRATRQRRTPS